MRSIILPFAASVAMVIGAFVYFEQLESVFTELLSGVQEHTLEYVVSSGLILSSDIVLPVPSTIVMYTNGYVLGIGPGALLSLLAMMMSSLIGYYLARFTAFGIKSKTNEAGQRVLERYGGLAILVTRGVPVLAESISFVCGYNRMPFRYYVILHLIGYVPVVLLYAIFGSIGYDNNIFFLSFGLSLLISAGFWFFGRKLIQRIVIVNNKPA